MKQSLDSSMIKNHRLLASHRTTALNHRHHTGKFQPVTPNPILHTSRIKITIAMIG
jgi:hypothetical protein